MNRDRFFRMSCTEKHFMASFVLKHKEELIKSRKEVQKEVFA